VYEKILKTKYVCETQISPTMVRMLSDTDYTGVE
jgi:hypothetical protein